MSETYVRVPRQDERPEKIVSNQPEVGTIYVTDEDRFVVSLVVGYTDDIVRNNLDGPKPRVEQLAKVAASAALQLTRDAGSDGTYWFVFDRRTGRWFEFEQGDFEDIPIR